MYKYVLLDMLGFGIRCLSAFFLFSILPRDLYHHLEVYVFIICIYGLIWKSCLFVCCFVLPSGLKARHVYTMYFVLIPTKKGNLDASPDPLATL